MDKVNLRGSVLRTPSDESRVVTFRASTPAVDSHGTRILPEGIDTTRFETNPVFLWGHDGYAGLTGGPSIDSVIGRVVAHSKTAEAFDVEVEFAPAALNPRAEQAFQLVRNGFLNAVSIGFVPKKWQDEEENDVMVRTFNEVELYEVSLVPIPSNPEAVALARGMFGSERLDLDQAAAVDTFLRAGKVLSRANADKLRQAARLLNEVIAAAGEEAGGQDEQRNSAPPAPAADPGADPAAAIGAAIAEWRLHNAIANTVKAA